MNRSTRVAIPLTVTLLLLLGLFACTSEPPTNQRPTNAGIQSTQSPEIVAPPPTCDPTKPVDTRKNDMVTHLTNNGLGDTDLEKQRGPNKAFQVDFVVQGNLVVMKVKGRLAGGSQTNTAEPKPKLKHLIDALDKYMRRGCADRVSFEGLTATSFEYEACPFPSQPCPDGSCNCEIGGGSSSSSLSVNENSAMNSNANSSANKQGNSNSNTSGNSNPNSKSRTSP